MSSESRVAIVTGAVSGIGAELVRHLIAQGWKVAGMDLTRDKGEALAKELGDSFEFFQGSVASYDDMARVFSQTFDKWKRIDAFCSNAGIGDQSSVYILQHRGKTEIPPAPNTLCTDVCLKALLYGTQLSIHFMRQNATPGGNIVATSSMVGVHAVASFPEYGAAKAAINNMVQAAAPILKLHENITINAVCPGAVATSLVNEEMRATFGVRGMTPVSTIVGAYDRFLNDRSLTGELMECSIDKHFILPKPIYADGEITKRTCTVYDPLFVYLHGQSSGLSDIVRPLD